MDYLGILKRAYEITLKHKYLWIFGILAGGIGGANFNMTLPSSNDYSDKFGTYLKAGTFDWGQFWVTYWGMIVAIAGLFLLIVLIWLILSVIAQGALLGSVESIEKGQENNFRIGFAYGWHKFWRVFAVGLLIGLFVIFSLIILTLPVILFVLAKIYVLAIIYGILVFFLDLIFWLYLAVISPYILREAVLGNQGAWEAIVTSWDFFKLHWKEILVMYLLLLAVGIVIGVGLLLAIVIVGGLLAAIGFGVFLASKLDFWIYLAVFGFCFLVLLMILGGVINTFNSSVLTLVYLELVKKS